MYCCLLGLLLCIVSFVSFRWYMICLLVVLVKLSVLAKWLARNTPLRKPNCAEGPSPKRPGQRVRVCMILLVYSIVSLFNCMVLMLRCPTWYTLYFYGTIQPVCAESAVKPNRLKMVDFYVVFYCLYVAWTCTLCEYAGSSSEAKIEDNNNDVTRSPGHDSPRPYLCTVCRKGFAWKCSLNDHRKIHDGNNLFSCTQCKRRFTSQQGLKKTYEYSYR